jgi:chromosomal replication initiation ATPase DnaA
MNAGQKQIDELQSVVDELEPKISLMTPTQVDKLTELIRRLYRIVPKMELNIETVEEIVLPFVFTGTKEEFRAVNKSRKKEFVRGRSYVFLFSRIMLGKSTQNERGSIYGKDHASVRHCEYTLLNELYLPENKSTYSAIAREFESRGYKLPKYARPEDQKIITLPSEP